MRKTETSPKDQICERDCDIWDMWIMFSHLNNAVLSECGCTAVLYGNSALNYNVRVPHWKNARFCCNREYGRKWKVVEFE